MIVNLLSGVYYFIEVKVMKKTLFLSVFFMCLLICALFSESEKLDSVIDFSISIKELSNTTPELLDNIISTDKYLILNGTISDITEIERTETNLILDIHLVNGAWIGLEKVEVYKCIINVTGKEWENRFPKRKPREIEEEHILVNNRILVIGKAVDYVIDDSFLTVVINAENIRKIQ